MKLIFTMYFISPNISRISCQHVITIKKLFPSLVCISHFSTSRFRQAAFHVLTVTAGPWLPPGPVLSYSSLEFCSPVPHSFSSPLPLDKSSSPTFPSTRHCFHSSCNPRFLPSILRKCPLPSLSPSLSLMTEPHAVWTPT